MTDRWTDRLSEYLDGDLSADECAALEAHLRACPACRSTVDGLRRVMTSAHTLVDRPVGDLWYGISARIGAEAGPVVSLAAYRARRRVALTIPQLAAAAVLLVSLSIGAAWLALRPAAERPVALPAPRLGGAQVIQAGLPTAAEQSYEAAVTDLERALEAGRSRLDPRTVAVLEKNLRRIDDAITEARTALEADPANGYLNSHLANTMQQKIALLKQATTLADAAS
jgi:anti-sigma factor RsiW